MRRNKTYSMILFLVAGLFSFRSWVLSPGRAQEQGVTLGMQVRLDRLASEAEGYHYQVGYSPAMDFSLDQLCGWWNRMTGRKRPLSEARQPAGPPFLFRLASGGAAAREEPGRMRFLLGLRNDGAPGKPDHDSVRNGRGSLRAVSRLLQRERLGLWWGMVGPRLPRVEGAGRRDRGRCGPGGGFPLPWRSNAACNSPYDHAYRIDNWAYVPGNENDVDEIKQAIYQYGPVAAAVAVGSAFQGYSEGVFDNDESGSVGINHAIVLVGWDDAYSWDGETYGVWILRNSWGSGWGEGGYMYITYGTSRVGYAANYIEYVHTPDFRLVVPENGASSASPPTFSWTGPYEIYLFYSVFHYDLGYWSGYYPAYFGTLDTSYTIPSTWWDKVDGSMASYWAVCGQTDGWECTEARSFTKGVSATSGE